MVDNERSRAAVDALASRAAGRIIDERSADGELKKTASAEGLRAAGLQQGETFCQRSYAVLEQIWLRKLAGRPKQVAERATLQSQRSRPRAPTEGA